MPWTIAGCAVNLLQNTKGTIAKAGGIASSHTVRYILVQANMLRKSKIECWDKSISQASYSPFDLHCRKIVFLSNVFFSVHDWLRRYILDGTSTSSTLASQAVEECVQHKFIEYYNCRPTEKSWEKDKRSFVCAHPFQQHHKVLSLQVWHLVFTKVGCSVIYTFLQ